MLTYPRALRRQRAAEEAERLEILPPYTEVIDGTQWRTPNQENTKCEIKRMTVPLRQAKNSALSLLRAETKEMEPSPAREVPLSFHFPLPTISLLWPLLSAVAHRLLIRGHPGERGAASQVQIGTPRHGDPAASQGSRADHLVLILFRVLFLCLYIICLAPGAAYPSAARRKRRNSNWPPLAWAPRPRGKSSPPANLAVELVSRALLRRGGRVLFG